MSHEPQTQKQSAVGSPWKWKRGGVEREGKENHMAGNAAPHCSGLTLVLDVHVCFHFLYFWEH